jgi:hypothetical protein
VKKLLTAVVAMMCAFSLTASAKTQILARGGVDISGKVTFSNGASVTDDVKTGASVGADIVQMLGNTLSLGIGAEWQIPRAISGNTDAKFGFVPVYGTIIFYPALYKTNTKSDTSAVNPYLKGNIGYSFLTSNDTFSSGFDKTADFYWAAGGGVQFNRVFFVEAMYSESKGKIDTPIHDLEVKYTKVGISGGYMFDLGF